MMLSRLLAIAGLVTTLTIHAHDGHDHAAIAAAHDTAIELPRLSFASERLELVAVAHDDRLEVYVDDYNSNAPLNGLTLRLRTPTGTIALQEREPGLYVAPLSRDTAPLAIALDVGGDDWHERYQGELPGIRHTQIEPPSREPTLAWLWLLAVGGAIVVLRAWSWRRARR